MAELKFESGKSIWIEPEITTLEIDETNLFPGIGADGSSFPDCTRS